MPILARPTRKLAIVLCSTLGAFVLGAGPVAAEEKLHEVTTTPAKAAAGAPAKGRVTLSAKNGWKMNDEAPVTLKITPAPGIALDKPKLGRKDLAESHKDHAAFDVGFTASEPGKKAIDCEASFVICQESACKQVREKVVLNVDVAAAKNKKK